MSNLLQKVNFNIECDCAKLWTDEVFEDVLAARHRTRYEFKTRVTYDCLKQILSWSHSKMLAIKRFTAKKSVVLNDDEPRLVPIPKDFPHLMIRKIDEAYIGFIQSRSDALVEMSEYTLKSNLPQVKHFKVHLFVHFLNVYCFNIFLTQVSAFAYLIIIYNSLFYISFQVL